MRTLALLLMSLITAAAFAGQTVRIATVDGGVDLTHPSLEQFKWVNEAEEAGEAGVDDDGNGYKDDVNGYNLVGGNAELFPYASLPPEETFVLAIEGFDLLMRLNAGQELSVPEKTLLEERLPLVKRHLVPILGGMHGTHVSGIMAAENEDLEIVGVKILAESASEEITYPGMFKGAEVFNKLLGLLIAIFTVTPDKLVAELRNHYETQQRPFLEQIGSYLAKQQVRVANCSWGEGEKDFLNMLKQQFPHIYINASARETVIRGYRTILAEVYPVMTKAAPATLFVMAAGNSAIDNDQMMTMPANIAADNKITVACLNAALDGVASFSNTGAEMVEIAAPGELIRSATPYGKSVLMSGTSMAAPFVSKVASMVLQANPALTPAKVKRILMDTADQKKFLRGKVKSGAVNLERAVEAATKSAEMELEEAIAAAREEIPAEPEAEGFLLRGTGAISQLSVETMIAGGYQRGQAEEITRLLERVRRVIY
ncbi:MAG: hypothetical protein A2284_05170 [Deltaproteobacteria bacterium RIFOXYA12_FULL_61_11]|nr:MAG: hypothetical protein A2284_05170 [Deltaproteobacteria bacterium RIFOXYA12_FULL_61_11]